MSKKYNLQEQISIAIGIILLGTYCIWLFYFITMSPTWFDLRNYLVFYFEYLGSFLSVIFLIGLAAFSLELAEIISRIFFPATKEEKRLKVELAKIDAAYYPNRKERSIRRKIARYESKLNVHREKLNRLKGGRNGRDK